MEREEINIPSIVLKWSEWVAWKDLVEDARQGSGVKVPNKSPGVYEVKYTNADERLTIGKASNLRMRIKQGLVKGKSPHLAGKKIRAEEDLSRIMVRWAVTDRPAAVEEELHKRHQAKFGSLPRYVKHT
jgi:excinuclease UvrABC nuclease subunit